jgi:DNA-binding transcriptional LysR family regulator
MNEINISGIKLSQIRALVTVAKCGNFSEAALQLDISQSAVSHAIASLEEELGVVLLSRGRHGAHLTPVGERVIDYGRQVLQLLQEMAGAANLEKGLNGGIVRVACFRSVATHVLPAVIAQFQSRFPEITVTIVEHSGALTVEKALREGSADIGFTNLPTSNEFETREIIRDEYVVLLPPTAKLQTAQLTWEQLATYPLIFPSSACHHLIRKHLQLHKFLPNIAYKVQESSTIVSMVAQGLGAAILAQLSAAPLPPEVQVCCLPVPLERVIGVAVLANALLTPAAFAFLETLRSVDRFTDKTAV